MQTFALPQDELKRRLDILTRHEGVPARVLCEFLGIDRHNLIAFRKGRQGAGRGVSLILSDFFNKWDQGLYSTTPRGRGIALVHAAAQRPLLHGQVTLVGGGPRLRWKTLSEIVGFDAWQPGQERKRPSGRRTEYSRSMTV